MQKYEETHQLVISRKRERKKKNATISGIKVQTNGRAEMKATGRFIDAVLGLHSPDYEVATSRSLKEFDASRDRKNQISS